MNKKQAKKLFTKYINNECSLEELQLLETFLDSYQDKNKTWAELEIGNEEAFKKNSWSKIESQINKGQKKKSYPFLTYIKYAAVAIIFLGIGYFYQQGYFSNKQELIIPSESITLELENGNIQIINEDGSTKVVDVQGKVVGTQSGNELVYSNNLAKEKLVYNTLTIPYAKRFKIQLSDGTNVHLNAGSSLKYPINFIEGEKRRVFLTGEAFFDVTSDVNHPFIVNAETLNVKVLGTEFNVSAYPEANEMDVVLVEGSVIMGLQENHDDSKPQIILKPGFKGSFDRESKTISTEKVNTSIYTSWLEGAIVFRKESFANIIQRLERHYNVTIMNSNKELSNETFNATFEADNETIEDVLNYFNKVYQIEYSIEDNKIIIN